MRIVFICGSLEAGCDGVGDYVRQLALSLADNDHTIAIVAVNDRFIMEIRENTIQIGKNNVAELRLPEIMDIKEKKLFLKKWIDSFNPDWLSLQYVPFSFQRRGLCFGLAKMLRYISIGRQWELMVHEIGVGLNRESNLKEMLWGKVQTFLVADLINVLKPAVIHTQTLVYKKLIEKRGHPVILLSLFSNIPLVYPEAVKNKIDSKTVQNSIVDIVVFASIQPGGAVRELAIETADYGELHGLKFRLVLVGRSGKEQQKWIDAWQGAGSPVEILGEQSEDSVSKILSEVRFGIFTTPVLLAGKSGAVAAMRDHGIHLLCVSRSWNPRGLSNEGLNNAFNIFEYKPGGFAAYFQGKPDFNHMATIHQTCNQFINDLLNFSL